MGLFSAPKGNTLYYSNSVMRSHPELHRRGLNESTEEKKAKVVENPEKHDEQSSAVENNDDDKSEDKPKLEEKKVGKIRNKEHFDPLTSKNTEFNSLIYHTSDDTIDLYAKENNSSDLIGRLYYDDFDSDSVATTPIASVSNTPLLSPQISGISTHNNNSIDYFSLSSRLPSSTNLKSLSSTNLKSVMSSSSTSIDEKFKNGVSFDISGDDSTKKSLTIKVKHPKFRFRRNNKTFLCGYNDDIESLKAIKWLFDEMIINGDTIVILQVLDTKLYNKIDKKQINKNLFKIEELNIHNKKISIVYEVDIGKPQKLLQRAIDEYKPQMMCIGTHQEEELQHKSIFAKTTLSNYFLQYALVPVVIVKPKYNHVTILNHEITSVDYFKNWLKDIDISDTYDKKKKTRPSFSRHNSMEDRGRSNDQIDKFRFLSRSRSRSTSESRKDRPDHERSSSKGRTRLSKLFHIDD